MSLGLFDRLLEDVARRRRRAMGRRAKPRLSIIDTQAVKCIPVRGPRGYDANKKVLGRKRVALVDTDGTLRMAPGWPLPLSPPRCRTATRSKLLIEARRRGPACGRRSWTGPSRLRAARSGRTGTACASVVERDPAQTGFVVLAGRWVVERSFGWLVHWGGLLRDRAGRLDVSAARIAFAASLSGVEALLNPMPVQDAAR